MTKLAKSLDLLNKSVDSLQKNAARRLIQAQSGMMGPDYGKIVDDKAKRIKEEHAEPDEDLETKVRERYKLDKAEPEMDHDCDSIHNHELAMLYTATIEELHRRRNIGQSLHKSSYDDLMKDEEEKKKKKEYIPRYKILTAQQSNPKTAKGEDLPYQSALLHLAPHTLAGCGNVCPAASKGCIASCLNTAGRGGMIKKDTGTNTIQQARIRRTKELHEDPSSFWKKLNYDIHMLKNNAKFDGKEPAVRLNGTSDIAWEDFRPPEMNGQNIFEHHPDVKFYDYTKRPDRMMKEHSPNYHLTFSRSEANHHVANKILKNGHNVTVVFGGKEMPEQWNGHQVISGDEHDFRFMDPKAEKGRPGYVVGLKAKGEAGKDTSGFVVWDHDGNQGKKIAAPKEGEAGGKLDRVKAAQGKLDKSSVYTLEKKDSWESDYNDHKFDQESADIIKDSMSRIVKPSKPKLQSVEKPNFPNLHSDMKATAERQKVEQKPGALDYSKMKTPVEKAPKWKQKADASRSAKQKEAVINAGGEKKIGPREIANIALENRRKAQSSIKPKFSETSSASKNKALDKSESKWSGIAGAMANHVNKKLLDK